MNFLDKYFDDIGVGERYRSRGRTITEADIVQWCALTGDWYVLLSGWVSLPMRRMAATAASAVDD